MSLDVALRAALTALGLLSPLAAVRLAHAQATEPQPEEDEPDEAETTEGFVLPPSAETTPPLVLLGYVDVGFADAQGDGTSFPDDYNPMTPADYGVDTFAPAVNSRGEVASNDPGDRMTNGFLPRSVAIGGKPSFLLNSATFDLRYQSPAAPIMVFTRLHVLPRFGGRGRGNQPWLNLEQAFVRVTPISGHEFFLSAGKFDSVFGIEYLDNQSPYRIGVTPSLIARYTTGTSTGVKAFFRQQIAPLWSALSLNAAATNSGTYVEALKPPDASLTGRPVLSARLGYELNLPKLQIKAGGSVDSGPRNDQIDRAAMLFMWGVDGRVNVAGLSLSGEYAKSEEDAGEGPKQTGLGAFPAASAFEMYGYWVQAAYAFQIGWGPLRAVTPYARYEEREAGFEEQEEIEVTRITAGLRVDLWDALILKAEILLNEEEKGAPEVDNNVFTSSVVYSW